jgi:myo-inositol 2-dehydrogenase/D-chiro-inositol 1-dehydrogenase
MADAELAVLHLAVGRSHRRAARTQPRRGELGVQRPGVAGLRDGKPAARTGEIHGNISAHFTVEFWYPNGARTISTCRQSDKCSDRIGERVVGTKGASDCCGRIWDHKGKTLWEYKGENPNPYVLEHADLVASIRGSGPHFNEAKQVAESTLAAIMGRMSAYTGREIQTSWALKTSKLDLVPADLKFGPKPVDPVAKPGETALI